jgi:phospholipid/cholesterol/gamma-HCH transport system substrate-binding protein
MEDRVVQLRVGLMVVASLLVAAILVVLLGESPEFVKEIFRHTYTIRVWFPEARGLSTDSLVRRNGILVGRVASVAFAEEEGSLVYRDGVPLRQIQFRGEKQPFALPEGISTAEYQSGVIVTAAIRRDARLYGQDVCRIQSDLLGKPTLHFAFSPAEPAPAAVEGGPAGLTPLDPGQAHFLKGQIAPDPLDSISVVTKTLEGLKPAIENASTSLADAGTALKTAAEKVSDTLNDDTQKRIQEAAELARKSLSDVQDMIGDETDRQNFKQTLSEIPDFIDELRTTMAKAQARMDEIQTFTTKLGSPETINRLDRVTYHLDTVMEDLSAFSSALKDPQGSLGLLLEDRQLYDHLNRAAENVEDVSRRLEPILNDVRIFTDKVARHPEVLGARGVLERSPGIK